MAQLIIRGLDRSVPVNAGASLLDTVMHHQIPISTSCGGVAACGLCRLTVHSGAEMLSKVHPREIEHLGDAGLRAGMRLACQARLVGQGDIEVEIPPVIDAAARRQAKLTRALKERRQQSAASKNVAQKGSAAVQHRSPQNNNRGRRP